MTTIPASAIRLAYLWPCNLAHAAFTLSRSWKTKITADELDLRFDSECVNHPLLHELGERPAKGFARSHSLLVAERIITEEHNACAEL
jgi:hypothetical protein